MRAQIWILNQRSSKNFNNFRHLQANPLDISGRNEYIVGGKQKNQCFPPGSCPVRRFLPRSSGAQVAPSCGAIFPLSVGPTTAEVRLAGPCGPDPRPPAQTSRIMAVRRLRSFTSGHAAMPNFMLSVVYSMEQGKT